MDIILIIAAIVIIWWQSANENIVTPRQHQIMREQQEIHRNFEKYKRERYRHLRK